MDWTQTYPGLPSMVPVSRVFVRAMLEGSPRRDEAELVVAEFAANSLRHTPSGHAGGTFAVTVATRSGWARVAVTDAGQGGWTPHVARPDDDEEYGRGLLLVESSSDKIGHDFADGHQTMWAEFEWEIDSGPLRPCGPDDE